MQFLRWTLAVLLAASPSISQANDPALDRLLGKTVRLEGQLFPGVLANGILVNGTGIYFLGDAQDTSRLAPHTRIVAKGLLRRRDRPQTLSADSSVAAPPSQYYYLEHARVTVLTNKGAH